MKEAGDCIFCKIIRKEIPAAIIFENDTVLAFEDLHPQAPVHVLIIPKKHISGIAVLEPADALLAGELIIAAKSIAEAKGLSGSGYRVAFNSGKDAGQEVLHLHLHMLGGRKFTWPPG